MVGDASAVVHADDGLGAVHPVVVVFHDPVGGEVGVELAEVGDEVGQQFGGFLAVEVAVAVGVVGEIDDVMAAVEAAVNHIGMLNDADEGQGAVGHIEPVFGGEGAIQHQDQQHRREVLCRFQDGAVVGRQVGNQAGEYVGGGGGDDGVVFVIPGRAVGQGGGEAGGLSVGGDDALDAGAGMHLPALGDDVFSAGVKDAPEAAHRVAEPLFLHTLAGGDAQVNLAPEPGHADAVVVVAELAAQHWFPDDAVGGFAHIAADPFGGGYALVFAPVAGFLEGESPQAEADALEQGQGRKAQQVQGGGKVPDAAIVEEADFGFQPVEFAAQPEFLDEAHHIGVADEEVVVAAFQVAAADGEGGGLSAEEGGGFEDFGEVSLSGEFVGGGQAGGAAADNSNAHRANHPG